MSPDRLKLLLGGLSAAVGLGLVWLAGHLVTLDEDAAFAQRQAQDYTGYWLTALTVGWWLVAIPLCAAVAGASRRAVFVVALTATVLWVLAGIFLLLGWIAGLFISSFPTP